MLVVLMLAVLERVVRVAANLQRLLVHLLQEHSQVTRLQNDPIRSCPLREGAILDRRDHRHPHREVLRVHQPV